MGTSFCKCLQRSPSSTSRDQTTNRTALSKLTLPEIILGELFLDVVSSKVAMFTCVKSNKGVVLPKMPVPPLQQTTKKYLSYLKIMASDKAMVVAIQLTNSFVKGDAIRLQNKIVEHSSKTENWINDFWLDEFFLSIRRPIPIYNSKGIIFPKQRFFNINDQLTYASRLVTAMVDLRMFLRDHQLPEAFAPSGMASQPLNYFTIDLSELLTIFHGYRMPGIGKDLLIQHSSRMENEHIIIAYKNHFFVLNVMKDAVRESEDSICWSLSRCTSMADEEEALPVGIFTCADRSTWAGVRKLLERDNRDNLMAIEKSLFVLCIDHYTHDKRNDTRSSTALQMLCGIGNTSANRWFDKPIQLIVNHDGNCGMCWERSAVDDVIVSSFVHHLLLLASWRYSNDSLVSSMDQEKEGTCSRLVWTVSDQDLLKMSATGKTIAKQINDIDCLVSEYGKFGYELIKKHGIKSEVFMQLALQLAYYRVTSRVANSYTGTNLRRFRLGREENCRSLTSELVEWCKAMMNISSKKRNTI